MKTTKMTIILASCVAIFISGCGAEKYQHVELELKKPIN
jgi:hypothetical protein